MVRGGDGGGGRPTRGSRGVTVGLVRLHDVVFSSNAAKGPDYAAGAVAVTDGSGFLPTRPGVPLCSLFGSLVLVGPDSRFGFRRTRSRWKDRCRSGVCLCEVKIVRKGGGAGFEPMTCSGGVLRFRARCQSCTVY